LASGNQVEAVEAFNQARAALELPEEFDFDQKIISLQQHLENLQANWNGLTTITAQVVGDDLNPQENRVLQTISTEAINNAVRHGNASHIDLTITVEPDVISIVARNDGTLHANEKRGMGLSALDQYSRNDWSLTTDEHGKVLLQARIKRA
jgi:signal transduction histidine kinase